jgi:hypothetical protein
MSSKNSIKVYQKEDIMAMGILETGKQGFVPVHVTQAGYLKYTQPPATSLPTCY